MLFTHFKASEEHLLAISRIPANSGHPLHKGTPREAFIKEFLENHLSSNVAIGSGEIIDCKSKPAEPRNQFDIVLYKRTYPKLDFGGGINGFLVESTIATIEVKSLLDKGGIEQAVGAARIAKQLQKSEFKSFSTGYIPPSVLSYVVAYDGPTKMETVYKWIKEVYESNGISEPDVSAEGNQTAIPSPALDGVFLLGRGFLNYHNTPFGFLPDEFRKAHPEVRWVIADAESGSLLSLFLNLTSATSNIEGTWLNPGPYTSAFRVSVRFCP